uniref:RNA-dependent RNA polymerase n=1 Tax=de Nodal virus TaxID=2707288 RepID=A0A6H0DH54_9VIRU|nr:MAG: RNA-dependent RNA polymerase [de Nodal virus]
MRYAVMDRLQKKIAYSALPRHQARAWCSWHQHAMSHKGAEWLAQRDKALWQVANIHRTGDMLAPVKAIQVMQSERIAHNRSGYPLGVEGAIVRMYAEAQRPSAVRRLAAVLRGYTSIRLKRASKAQVEKASKSINSPPAFSQRLLETVFCHPVKRPDNVESLLSYLARVSDLGDEVRVVSLLPRLRRGNHPWYDESYLDTLRLPAIIDLSGTSMYPGSIACPRSIKEKPFGSLLSSLLTAGRVPTSLLDCYPTVASSYDRYGHKTKLKRFPLQEAAAQFQLDQGHHFLGKIVLLQEGGAKGRVICSPNAWIQMYMYPLHQLISCCIRDLEATGHSLGISCMFDQIKGAEYASMRIQQGGYVSAVDLSSATDRFPLAFQQGVLMDMGLERFALALTDLTGPYKGLDGQPWYYRTGQPMGLYGSFPLFHLSHWSLLEGLASTLFRGLVGSEPLYAILGDDVLIFDKALEQLYMAALSEWGVPVSTHKCYSGDNTEFAGFMISRKGDYVSTFRPYKHPAGNTAAALPLCHAIGSRVKTWSPWWHSAYMAYQATLGLRDYGLTPLVTDQETTARKAAPPGESYLSSLVTMLSYVSPITPEPLRAWDECCLSLLQVKESLADIGHVGVQTGHAFDVQDYIAAESLRKDTAWQRKLEFTSDPLVAEYRARIRNVSM